MAITREFVRAVRGRLAENPGVSTGWLAVELGAREADVLTSLPVAMRRRARLEDREAICGLLAGLGLPPGPGVNDAGGREVGSIWFVADKPDAADGLSPGSVRFMDRDGGLLCLVRLNGEFHSLWRRFGVKDVPPKKRCCCGAAASSARGCCKSGGKGRCGDCRCRRGLPCCGGHGHKA